MTELNLSPRSQTALSEFASLASSTKHYLDTLGTKINFANIGEKFCEILDRHYNISPQDWGVIYDKLHRTGANS